MIEYYFLFGLAFIYVIFAAMQDLKKREIANWLSFSLVVFVLAYRAFYSVYAGVEFFIYGFLGVLMFFALGYLLYYGRAFAGGDAKLLIGLGGIFPYSNLYDYLFYGIGFVFLTFLVGSLYGILYTFFLIGRNRNNFKREFRKEFYKNKLFFILVAILAIIFQAVILYIGSDLLAIFSVVILLLPLLFTYARAVEKGCLIKLVRPDRLTEGDWLGEDVHLPGKIIRRNSLGLTRNEIKILVKEKKEVLVKDGIPFAPAFLISLIVASAIIFLWYSPL